MTLYLDTSSLVKLYVVEPGSESVRRLVDAATIVATSSIAYTETRAALARRRREHMLRPKAFASAKKNFENEWPSMHLAAFVEVAREAGVRETRFSSFDDALNRAAQSLRRTLTRAR
jgi:predicted nucleic acid-binding protein